MTLDAVIMLAGALVALVAISGFPPSWYHPVTFLLGILVVILGIIVRRKRGDMETAQRLRIKPQSPPTPPDEGSMMGN